MLVVAHFIIMIMFVFIYKGQKVGVQQREFSFSMKNNFLRGYIIECDGKNVSQYCLESGYRAIHRSARFA